MDNYICSWLHYPKEITNFYAWGPQCRPLFLRKCISKKVGFLKGEQCGFLKLYLFMDLCQIASAKEVHTPFFDTLLIFHSNIILRRTVELALYIFLLLHILSEITRPFLAFHFTIWALKKTKKRPISDVIFRLLTTPLKKNVLRLTMKYLKMNLYIDIYFSRNSMILYTICKKKLVIEKLRSNCDFQKVFICVSLGIHCNEFVILEQSRWSKAIHASI